MEFPWVKKMPDWMRSRSAADNKGEQTAEDRELAMRLMDMFESPDLDIDVTGVQFYVFKGAVSLYGTLPSREAREELLHRVSDLEGVRRVINHFDDDHIVSGDD